MQPESDSLATGKPRRRIKRRWKFLGALTLVVVGGVFFVSGTIGGAVWYSPEICSVESADSNHSGLDNSDSLAHSRELTVVTLNIAHGRNQSVQQVFLSEAQLGRNLKQIVDLLDRIHPDVVGLQEIDAPSFWTCRQDQTEILATQSAALPHYIHGRHVDGFGLHYGTAVLSRRSIQSAHSGRFSATPPTLPKGFVIAQLQCPQLPGGVIDFVSVHLDFASSARRSRQAATLIARLSARDVPLIVVGDFNCDWNERGSVLAKFCRELELHTYEPASENVTYPPTGTRLDWILASRHFEFQSFEVRPEIVSDHRAVVAKLRIR